MHRILVKGENTITAVDQEINSYYSSSKRYRKNDKNNNNKSRKPPNKKSESYRRNVSTKINQQNTYMLFIVM